MSTSSCSEIEKKYLTGVGATPQLDRKCLRQNNLRMAMIFKVANVEQLPASP